MKRFQTVAAYLVVLSLAGVASLKSAEPGVVHGKAVVRSVVGEATYTVNGKTMPLKVNKTLDAGVTVSTGPNTVVFMSVNGVTSAVRVAEKTTMAIPQMDRIGTTREGDTETMLDLKDGTILGTVKKIQANSKYDIKTPTGVAGIRGTDFEITVKSNGDGTYAVTFSSVKGEVTVTATVDSVVTTKTLHDGQAWTPGQGDVHNVGQDLLNIFSSQVTALMDQVLNAPAGTSATTSVPIVPRTPPNQNSSS